MAPLLAQTPDFVFEDNLFDSIVNECLFDEEDLGPTDGLSPDEFDVEYNRFFGFGLSPLSTPPSSPSPSRSASPSRPSSAHPDFLPTSPLPSGPPLPRYDPPALPSAPVEPSYPSAPPAPPTQSSSNTPSLPRKAQNSKARRNKEQSRKNRTRERRDEREESLADPVELKLGATSKYILNAKPSETRYRKKMPTGSSGYKCKPDHGESGRLYELKELVEKLGFKVEEWDGLDPRPILDAAGRIIAVLAGHPDDVGWEGVHQGAANTVRNLASRCDFPEKVKKHRRGRFPALSWGISYGGGQKKPGNLCQNARNARALSEITADKNFSRIATYGSTAFLMWAPKLYTHYESYLDAILTRDDTLRRNWPKSIFSSFALNFGPKTVCRPHRDFANLPFGWCSITALGDFDPTQGGHLILWDLKLAIQFPPGSTILIPSAALRHSNVPIRAGETRFSFTQYTAGGLFRWVDQGYQPTEEYLATLTAADQEEEEKRRIERCTHGLSFFSTLSSLPSDQTNRNRLI